MLSSAFDKLSIWPKTFVMQYFYKVRKAVWVQSCHPTLTDKKVCRPSVAIWLTNSWLQKCDNFPASFTDQVRLGYLDVAIAKKIAKLACHLVLKICDRGYLDVTIAKKICKTCMPSCAIDLWQRLFRCSHCKKIVSETHKKIQKFVSETRERIFRQWKSGCTS